MYILESAIPWLLFLSVYHYVCGAAPDYSTDLESELRASLFSGYEVLQRPNETVNIKIAFNLYTVNSMEIKDQYLSTSGYFVMQWTDDRLDWSSNNNYSNIRNIFSNDVYMWRPAIVVENSVDNLAVFSDKNVLIRIVSSGTAQWTPGGIFETNCDADVTYYPLDSQECSIVLTTWAYTSNEVSLSFGDEPFILDNFSENGEWEVTETTTSSESSTRARDTSNSYDRLYFTIKLKRRPLYHILNTIIPVLLMASLIVLVFKLPPESGERVGMSLTVLLAYAVYLTLISENIPKTSVSASILSTYLTIILILSTLSVVLTIVVLDIYFNHDDDEDPGKWIQTLTRTFLVKVAMWKGTSCCKTRKVKPSNDHAKSKLSSSRVKLNLEEFESYMLENKNVDPDKTDPTCMKTKERDDDVKIYSWKEVALILDRCFMYLFILLTVIVTLVCLAILCSKV